MRRVSGILTAAATVAALASSMAIGASPAAASTPRHPGAYVLTATHRGSTYAPTFTGNGYLGVRVPPLGEGYAGGTVPAQSEVAGYYAKPPKDVQQRANIPTWSTLTFRDNGHPYALNSGHVSNWRQRLNLHDGVVTTTSRWRAPNGHVTDVTYEVFTDRAHPYVATVRLTLVPHWTGRAAVADLLDGKPATLTKPMTRGWDTHDREIFESVRTEGTNLVAGLASRVALSTAPSSVSRIVPKNRQSAGQRISFAVAAGHRYTVTKYIGVVTSNESAHPLAFARSHAASAEGSGFAALHREDRAAWSRLWAGRVDVLGNRTLASEVNASEFYLWSSTRSGVDWSVSPAGLSSNGYDGHIFWDAETWMHPTLLAQHPSLAAGMDAYRLARLRAAQRHARQTGYRGARYPWESALDGTEQIPPPVSVNSEGLYEQHITGDIALAQWQYYLATGSRHWLRTHGWPVISRAATFWAGRVVRTSDGRFHIRHVTGPDEENPNVNDEAFTNVAAATSLRIATAAAKVLGRSAPASWQRIAAKLVVLYDRGKGIHPEFRGYQGQLVKQADVTMLQYPWARRMPARVAQRDLNYYVPRSDPGGPSMSDAISMIDTSALGSAGCASYVYTQRSILPFMRDGFDQFSETRDGGAFTFMTGIGGFLQEFLYGYSGLRMHAHNVTLDPMMNSQLRGVVLRRLAWHGRRYTVAIHDETTTVSLNSGPPMTVSVRGTKHTLSRSHPLTVRTRRPDTRSTSDVVRCASASASSAQPGAIPLAAVDGSPATGWQPTTSPANLTIAPRAAHTISHATVLWGRLWPPAPGPNIPPPATPVTTLRPSAYSLQVSSDGHSWHTVATEHDSTSRTRDTFSFPARSARYVRVHIATNPHGQEQPILEELTFR